MVSRLSCIVDSGTPVGPSPAAAACLAAAVYAGLHSASQGAKVSCSG